MIEGTDSVPVESPAPLEWTLADPAPERVILGGPFGREDAAASFERIDRFAELGGRLIETAYSYARGNGKQVVGDWVRANPGRLSVVTKVGHGMDGSDVPLDRATVLDHVRASVDVLDGEPLEVLMLHCDDPTRSVSELADTLREVRGSGLARRVGVSNWSSDRLAALAEDFAGDQVAPVASYQWSLATPIPELIHEMGLEADVHVRAVIRTSGLPLLCWSSQAQGWFARTDSVTDRPDPFDTADNRARRDRCRVLARQLGSEPAVVALAWTLHQRATWPTIGPSSIDHLESSMAAVRVSLSTDQLQWLVDGRDATIDNGV